MSLAWPMTFDQAVDWGRDLPIMALREAGLSWAEIAYDALDVTEHQARQMAGVLMPVGCDNSIPKEP